MNMEFRNDDVLPEHPGPLMKSWFMDRRDLSVEDVASRSGLPVWQVQDIIDAKDDIDYDKAIKLSLVFGSSAETLYRLQDEYDFYMQSRKIKDFDDLPRLNL